MRRLALALFLVACTGPRGGTASENTSSTRGAIQGGVLDTTNQFAIAIVDKTGGICSGTLIAPNLVLTARHCVADSGRGDLVDCTTDEFDSPRAASTFRVTTATTAEYDTAERSVTKIFVPNDSKFCGNDIALVMLDANVTGKFAEPMLDVPDLDAITAIGYGTTGTFESDDGKRRKLASVDVTCVPGIPARDCDLSSYQMTKSELAAGNGLCAGDSGSGAYVPASVTTTKPVVIGVLSRAGEDGDTCIDAIYTRTDGFKQLLVDAANEAATAGGYSTPTWAKPAGADPDPTPTPEDPTADPTPTGDETGDPAPAPPPSTTTTESGCAAAPGKSHDLWPFALVALAFIKRRRRSH